MKPIPAFKSLFLVVSLCASFFIFTACKTIKKDIIRVVGSTTVYPVAEKLTQAFGRKYPGYAMEIQAIGSSAGIKAVKDNTAHIGLSSRELSLKEASKLDVIKFAVDGLVLIVNHKNPINNLSKTSVFSIFSGNLKNWKDLDGMDKKIVVVNREEGSGSRYSFERGLNLIEKINGNYKSYTTQDAIFTSGNGAVKATVASKENVIGYISNTFLDNSVKALSIDGFNCSKESLENGNYNLCIPYYLVTNPNPPQRVSDFINFTQSPEGQEIISTFCIPTGT